MQQVTGVLEGDAQLDGVPLGAWAELGEELGDVDDGQVETGVLQMGSAAGRVDDDSLGPRVAEVLGEAARALVTLGAPARVQVQRTAAGLIPRSDDVAALRREHPCRRRVHVAEEHALDAAEQEADACPALAGRRGQRRRQGGRAPRRCEADQRAQRSRQRQAPAERRERERRAETPRMRKDGEDERPEQPVVRRPLVALLDQLARLLDQPVVLHAGGTGRDAGHAAEAPVEVLDDRVRELERALGQPFHQPDPPTRRVHLLLPERPVGRAGR